MEREQRDNSLHTIVIILLCCGAIKLLHLLGVISVEGESHQNPSKHHQNRLYLKMFSHGKLAEEEKWRIYSILQQFWWSLLWSSIKNVLLVVMHGTYTPGHVSPLCFPMIRPLWLLLVIVVVCVMEWCRCSATGKHLIVSQGHVHMSYFEVMQGHFYSNPLSMVNLMHLLWLYAGYWVRVSVTVESLNWQWRWKWNWLWLLP